MIAVNYKRILIETLRNKIFVSKDIQFRGPQILSLLCFIYQKIIRHYACQQESSNFSEVIRFEGELFCLRNSGQSRKRRSLLISLKGLLKIHPKNKGKR